MREKKFFRDCPSCGKQVGHVSDKTRKMCEGRNCGSCANRIKQTGVPLSDVHKASISATLNITKKAYTEMWGDKYKFAGAHFDKWSKAVKDRDNWTCLRCATVAAGYKINAHHIVPSQYFMARALDIDNGCTLCAKCHRQVHAELDTYVLNGVKFSATDFQNHLKGFINTWPDQKTKQ